MCVTCILGGGSCPLHLCVSHCYRTYITSYFIKLHRGQWVEDESQPLSSFHVTYEVVKDREAETLCKRWGQGTVGKEVLLNTEKDKDGGQEEM